MSDDLIKMYRGDHIELGDYHFTPRNNPGERCRWYQWIGGTMCDACGKQAWEHDGDLRKSEDSLFSRNMRGAIWSDEIRALWARSYELPARVPENECEWPGEIGYYLTVFEDTTVVQLLVPSGYTPTSNKPDPEWPTLGNTLTQEK